MINNRVKKPKLVVIGDSLSQGFQSYSIYKTEWSYPSMLARCLYKEPDIKKLSKHDFKFPSFEEEKGYGGLPLNFEKLIRVFEKKSTVLVLILYVLMVSTLLTRFLWNFFKTTIMFLFGIMSLIVLGFVSILAGIELTLFSKNNIQIIQKKLKNFCSNYKFFSYFYNFSLLLTFILPIGLVLSSYTYLAYYIDFTEKTGVNFWFLLIYDLKFVLLFFCITILYFIQKHGKLFWSALRLFPHFWSFANKVEQYWERGGGTEATGEVLYHHNTAVWGFEVLDCMQLTYEHCKNVASGQFPDEGKEAKPLKDDFVGLPEHPMYRTAMRTLNPLQKKTKTFLEISQIGLLHKIAEKEGQIENVIFWLGANNCLGTVVSLKIKESSEEDLKEDQKRNERTCNLWKPEHFKEAYKEAFDALKKVNAKNFFIGTVPHVVIPPIMRGITPGKSGKDALDGTKKFLFKIKINNYIDSINELNNLIFPQSVLNGFEENKIKLSLDRTINVIVEDNEWEILDQTNKWCIRAEGCSLNIYKERKFYYEYYTHFWIWDDSFSPSIHPHLTRKQAEQIDSYIDDYNDYIRQLVEEQNKEDNQRQWMIVDTCTLLDNFATRRRGQLPDTSLFPDGLIKALLDNEKTRNRIIPKDGKKLSQVKDREDIKHILLDTRFFNRKSHEEEPENKYQGGMFSLDGVHPTTVGYGIVAHTFLDAIKTVYGNNYDGDELDWKNIVENDTLLMSPPLLLNNLQQTFGEFSSIKLFSKLQKLLVDS